MPIRKIDNYVQKTSDIIADEKKKPNKIYRKCAINEKLARLKTDYEDITTSVEKIEDERLQKSVLLKVRQVYAEAKYLLETKLKQSKESSNFIPAVLVVIATNRFKHKIEEKKLKKMEEIIKLSSTLVPEYDGQSEKLRNITSALEALKLVTNAQTEPVAIQVVLSKLTKRASSAVGANPASLDVIIANLKEKCAPTLTSDSLFSKLKAIKQTGSLQKFTEEIEAITDKLEAALLQEDYSLENAVKVATKAGINALVSGVKKERTQIVLEAGNYLKLSDAISKAIEVDNKVQTANVFYNNSRTPPHRQSNRYNGNNQGRYNQNRYNGNYNQNQFEQHRNGYNNQNQNRGRSDRGGRGGFNNQRGGYNNNQNTPGTSRQIFCNSAENGQFPQQNRVGGETNQVQLNQLTNRQQNDSSR